jgi:hypothetical protein
MPSAKTWRNGKGSSGTTWEEDPPEEVTMRVEATTTDQLSDTLHPKPRRRIVR